MEAMESFLPLQKGQEKEIEKALIFREFSQKTRLIILMEVH